MRWDLFLDTADRLAGGATEGDWRSAVSRGYYGVFHFLREDFLAHGLDVGRAGVCHSNLYIGLLHCGVAHAALIAPRLDRLRGARTRADYDLSRVVQPAEAARAVREARSVIADYRTVRGAVSPAQIAAGAKKHLQSVGRIP